MRTPVVLACTLLVAASAAQEPTPEPQAPASAAERMQELRDLQQKAIADWQEATRKAQEEAKEAKPGEPVEAMSMRPDYGPIVAKAKAYAADFAGTDDAVPFLWFVVQNSAEKDDRGGALDTLLTAHLDSPELPDIGRMIPYFSQIVDEEFAEAAIARLLEGPDARLRGWALFAKHKGAIETADRDGEPYALAKKTLLATADASDDERLADEIRSAIDLREKFGAGNVAPDIVGIDLDGVAFKLSDYKGKVVFLDFWGDWWGPCRAMYPHERSLVEEMKDKPFALIGVNSDQTVERAKKAIAENNLNWRSFQNQNEGRGKPISDDWGVRGWPTIVVLDAEMKIHYRGHNGMEATEVAKALVEKMTE